MVKAVTVVVDADRLLARDAHELAMVSHTGQHAFDRSIRAVVCHYKRKLATHISELLLARVACNYDIFGRSGGIFTSLLDHLSLALGVTLDEALQGQVRAAELLHLCQLLLDTIVDLVAALLSGIGDL